MTSKEIVKQRIAYLRQNIAYHREQKKNENAFYSQLISNSSDKKQKANYRKNKADWAASRDRTIAGYKRELEAALFELKNCK